MGGQLAQASFLDETKNPRMISEKKTNKKARFVILDAQYSTFYRGATQTISQLRTRSCIPGRKNQVRQLFLHCVTCSRFTGKTEQQLLGDLLKEKRCVQSWSFQDVGHGLWLHFWKKNSKLESKTPYIALLICFASKTVHLKFLSD